MTKKPALLIAAVSALWLVVFYNLRLEWIVNPMYAYGWTIPFLAAYLFYERWLQRPAPNVGYGSAAHAAVAFGALAALLPVRVIQEANPDWVRINWVMIGVASAFSLNLLLRMGGWRYVSHFLFPVIFTFTAAAWPYQFEDNILQGLMRINAFLSAEIMTFGFGMPALAQGNLIFINGNWVNVEEACSGIRSLQTAFMMSLFFGEFYLLGIPARIALVVSSFALAFVLNLARTATLTYVSGVDGNEAVESWHDPLGYAILVCCLIGLWLLAGLFNLKKSKAPARSAADDEEPKAEKTPGEVVDQPRNAPGALQLPSAAFSIGVLLSLAAIEATTEWWYARQESGAPEPVEWAMEWPEDSRGFTQSEFPERTFAILKYNEAENAGWIDERDAFWSAYYIRWYAGRASKFLAGAHYPTVCLPATGLELDRQFEATVVEVEELTFKFSTFLFRRGDAPVYVFHAIMEDGGIVSEDEVTYKQVASRERLASVAKGYRNLGQRVVGISIEEIGSLYEAQSALRKRLPSLIVTHQIAP